MGRHLRKRDNSDLIGGADDPVSIPATMKTADLAGLLKISVRNVDMLVTKGVFAKISPATFDARASLAAYIEYARRGGNSDLDSEKLRLTREQADKIEIQNASARRELVSAAEVEREWSSILRDVRAMMLAIPSRVQQRLPHLTAHDAGAIDREIRDALQEVAHAND